MGSGCTVLGCGRKVIALGMCWNHYQRNRRGAPVFVELEKSKGRRLRAVKIGPRNASYSVRRFARYEWELREGLVTPEPNTGCLLWLGPRFPTGYGSVGTYQDPWSRFAHRAVLWFRGVKLERGRNDLHVRHICNNRACVNPDHLRYGTAAENMADRTARYQKGELVRDAATRGAWKMRPALVAQMIEMRAKGRTLQEIATALGVHYNTVRAHLKRHQQESVAA